jgi:hypothetical protein
MIINTITCSIAVWRSNYEDQPVLGLRGPHNSHFLSDLYGTDRFAAVGTPEEGISYTPSNEAGARCVNPTAFSGKYDEIQVPVTPRLFGHAEVFLTECLEVRVDLYDDHFEVRPFRPRWQARESSARNTVLMPSGHCPRLSREAQQAKADEEDRAMRRARQQMAARRAAMMAPAHLR